MVEHNALDRYLELYWPVLERMIDWSEVRLLRPGYLALHEDDIGIFGEYQLWQYLAAFLTFISDFRTRIRGMVLCYSYEKERTVPPERCRRDEFYYFKYECSSKENEYEIGAHNFVAADKDATRRPKPLLISQNLRRLLLACDYIQPYVLRFVSEEKRVVCNKEIFQKSEERIDSLIAEFQKEGAYQFSIYGYNWQEEHPPSNVELMVLQQAFVTHILTWNHDLKRAHEMRSLVSESMNAVRTSWGELTEKYRRVIHTFSLTREPRALPQLPTDEDTSGHLFDPTIAHDFTDMTPELFDRFCERVEERSVDYPELARFLNACGRPQYQRELRNLSQQQKLTWTRGMFLALKLLTRGLDEKDAKGLWADQVVLAVLRGLTVSGQHDVSVHIVYKSCGSAQDAAAVAGKVKDGFAKLCRIANPDKGTADPWPICRWKIEDPIEKDGRIWLSATWRYSGEGGELQSGGGCLGCFVRDGLLRNVADLFGPREEEQYYLKLPPYLQGRTSLAALVTHIARCVYVLAFQRAHKKEPTHVSLKKVEIVFEVTPRFAQAGLFTGRALRFANCRLELRLECDGILGRSSQSGSFWGNLNGLADCFGQISVLEARDGLGPGMFSYPRKSSNETTIFVVLDSGER